MLVSILNVCTEEELDEDLPFSEAEIGVTPTTTTTGATPVSPKAYPPSSRITSPHKSTKLVESRANEEEKANDGDDDSEMTLEEKKQALRNKIIAIGKMSRMFQVLREEQENVAHLMD